MELEDLQNDIEGVSAYYAERHRIDRTDDWFVLKLNEEVGELTQAYLARTGQARDKGRGPEERDADFRAEVADVLAQVLLVAERFDIDLADDIARKWLIWRRPTPAS